MGPREALFVKLLWPLVWLEYTFNTTKAARSYQWIPSCTHVVSKGGFNVVGVVLEDYYHLDRLQLETEGILRLEVVSADPIVHPIAAFQLPHEEKYVTDSYVFTVNVKDGVFQSYFFTSNGWGICFRPRARVRLSVCLQDYSETWIWMKCCVSTDVGTWMNWLTFESDPDHSRDARTGLFSPIAYALQLGILLPGTSGKSHVLVLGACRSSDA